MFRCPQCRELGYGSDQKACVVCLGWGVVVSLWKPCSTCKGKEKGCYACHHTGQIIDPIPYLETKPQSITMEAVRNALLDLRVGYVAEEPDDPLALAIVSILVHLSEQHRIYFGDADGAFLQACLSGDEVVLDPSGIWILSNGQGIRVHRFPLEEELAA